MNNWAQLGVFDLETTGVDVDTARIVSACVAILDPDGSVVARWDWLADPGIEIPAGAAAVHGITTERAQTLGRDARDVISEITQSLRVLFALRLPLVVYNAPYDLTLLDRECSRHGIRPLVSPGPVIDPLVLDKVVDKYRKGKRTLEVTAGFYAVELDDAHDAGADAIAAGRVALAIAAAHPEQVDVPPSQLHESQVVWYAEQAASFADYIRRVKGDQDFVSDTEWPVRTSEHPTSILDTQPIDAPSPRPSLRVPHLDFDTGVLVLDRPALEAASVLGVSAPAVAVESVEPEHVEPEDNEPEQVEPANTDDDAVVVEDLANPEPALTPWSLGALEVDEFTAREAEQPTDPNAEQATDPQTARESASGDLWTGVDFDVPEAEPISEPFVSAVPDTGNDPISFEPSSVSPERPTLRPTVLRVAAAIITDVSGRTLLVRKKGTSSFMQAGGKI
ncbi:MAG: hypothetical protein H7226_13260, partial [Salinibacterium sp.]|nr:hypothetical protein [Salinibacterium sp.]